MKPDKLQVIYFQRKPRPGFNFSIESIFLQIRTVLSGTINASVIVSSYYNDGYFTKIANIFEAYRRQKKNAIAHITGETHFLNLLMNKKNVVLTIHDCRFVNRKTGIQQKIVEWLYLQAPVAKSSFVTTVSEATKRDVTRFTRCNPDKIIVIPVPVNTIYEPSQKNFNKTHPLLLQIGTADNKNLERLINAITGLHCSLTIIGDLSATQLAALQRANINFSNLKNLADTELYEVYQQSDVVTFISTFEGFGMPIIEAQCVERPVITSNISSMPEVAGEGACFVDPYDVQSIRNGILKVINDDHYREEIIEKGRKNRKRFDATVIANQYFAIYQEIAKNF